MAAQSLLPPAGTDCGWLAEPSLENGPAGVPRLQAMPEKADTPSNFTLKLRKHIRCGRRTEAASGIFIGQAAGGLAVARRQAAASPRCRHVLPAEACWAGRTTQLVLT